MKYILILAIFLSGCATKQQNIQLNIEASAETMRDCEDLQLPKDFSFGSFVVSNLEYKKMYEQCKNFNKAKKQFILDLKK